MIERLQRVASLPPRVLTAWAVGKLFGSAAEHHFMDRVLNVPAPIWHPPYPWQRFTADEGQRHIETLRRDGIVMLPGFFTSEEMLRIRQALEAKFTPAPSAEFEFRKSGQFYACVQPLSLCREFAEAAVDPDLLNIVGGYFRRRPFLSESDFRRVLPLDMSEQERVDPKFSKGHSSSHWHYDLRGRQIKVMSYLTDVGPDDQNFAFCPRTHTGFKSTNYLHSRFSDRAIQEQGISVMECLAAAGTAVVFDTNGLHRLRRRKTRLRDSITFNYHPGRMYRMNPQRIHPGTADEARRRLSTLSVLAAEKKEDAR